MRLFLAVRTSSEEPEAAAFGVFDAVIVASWRARVTPPFGGDALGPFGARDVIFAAAPGEFARRTIWHFNHGNADRLRRIEHLDRPQGRFCRIWRGPDLRRHRVEAGGNRTCGAIRIVRVLGEETNDARRAEACRQAIHKIGDGVGFDRVAIQTGLKGVKMFGSGDRKPYEIETETGIYGIGKRIQLLAEQPQQCRRIAHPSR